MPTSPEGAHLSLDNSILYGPGKAANAGEVVVSGLKMAQNNMCFTWSREEVDNRLFPIMKNIRTYCVEAADRYGSKGNSVNGATITGFIKVVDTMMDQGVVWSRPQPRWIM